MSQVDLDKLAARERLKVVREQVLRLTKADLAKRLTENGCPTSASTLTNLESGRRNPGLGLALALETLTGIPASAWVPAREVA